MHFLRGAAQCSAVACHSTKKRASSAGCTVQALSPNAVINMLVARAVGLLGGRTLNPEQYYQVQGSVALAGSAERGVPVAGVVVEVSGGRTLQSPEP